MPDLNLTPISLLKVLQSLNLNLPVNTAGQNPILQSVVTTEAGQRFEPKLPVSIAAGVRQTVSTPQSPYQQPQSEEIINFILQNLAQLQKTQVPSSLSAPQSPVLDMMKQYLSQGLISDITASYLKKQLDQLKSMLPTTSTTQTEAPLQSNLQTPIPQASQRQQPQMQVPSTNPAFTDQQTASLLKSIQGITRGSR